MSTPFCKAMVTEVVESHLGDAGSGKDTLQYAVHTVWRDGAACWRWEHIFDICLGFLLLENFYRLG